MSDEMNIKYLITELCNLKTVYVSPKLGSVGFYKTYCLLSRWTYHEEQAGVSMCCSTATCWYGDMKAACEKVQTYVKQKGV